MATSTISNTIKDPTGTAVAGVPVIVRLKGGSFRITEGTEIAREERTETDVNGLWSLDLERNSNIDPTGTYYTVEEQVPDERGGRRVFTFIVGATNQVLKAALVAPAPAIVGPTYLTQAAADARYVQLGSIGGSAPADVATAASEGVGVSAARADHVHKLGAGSINSSGLFVAGVVDAAAIGSGAVGFDELAGALAATIRDAAWAAYR